jgi:hypothetical protein
MHDVQHIAYRTIGGRQYVRVEHAVKRMRMMTANALDGAAALVLQGDILAGLDGAIRALKPALEAVTPVASLTIGGRDYVPVEYATAEMQTMVGEALDSAAELIATWPPGGSMSELADVI